MMLLLVLSGVAAAAVAPVVARAWPRAAGWLLALHPLAQIAVLAASAGPVMRGEAVRSAVPWVPQLGIEAAFSLDGLSLLFALLVCGVGALVLVYAGGYLAGHPLLGRFYAFLILFKTSMLGLVLADDLILLFVFWELTSFTSYLLIGFDHQDAESRSAALQALLVTGGGGLAMLAGLVLLGGMAGTARISELAALGPALRADPLYLAAILLLLAGAFTKSAQVPFHFWLPSAMAAPAPVSAYLHSATMVKAGVYLLARFHPALGGTEVWTGLVSAVGAATMVVGAVMAVRQSDLKRLLAYSTVSSLGTLTLLFGLGTPAAATAGLVYLFAHALYKGALFLVAGVVDHETGTRDVRVLGGLRRHMPAVALAAGLAGLSMIGLPPLFGFIAKEMVYGAAVGDTWPAALLGIAVAANALIVVVAVLSAFTPFFGEETAAAAPAHAPPAALWVGPLVLAVASLGAGALPALTAGRLLDPATLAVTGAPATAPLALWHGWNAAFGLSLLTLAAAAAAWRLRGLAVWARLPAAGRLAPSRVYDGLLAALVGFAAWQTRLLQTGYLRSYLRVVALTIAGLGGAALAYEGLDLRLSPGDPPLHELAVALLILLATLAAVRSPSRLGAVAALGMVGYGIALIFVLHGAPDLAMTQVLVDTLTVILFVLVFHHLPRLSMLSTRRERTRDAVVALAVGAVFTLLVLATAAAPPSGRLSTYFAENSWPLAHGRNVVNVILVDFRALDTLGEITVLAVAGIGVFALLRLRPNGKAA